MWDGDWFFFCVVVAPVLAVGMELLRQVWRYYVPAERPRAAPLNGAEHE